MARRTESSSTRKRHRVDASLRHPHRFVDELDHGAPSESLTRLHGDQSSAATTPRPRRGVSPAPSHSTQDVRPLETGGSRLSDHDERNGTARGRPIVHVPPRRSLREPTEAGQRRERGRGHRRPPD